MGERAALFDIDGTICPGDSILPWLDFCVREGMAPLSQWAWAGGWYLAQRIRPDLILRAKEKTLSFIKGRRQKDLDEAAQRFFIERVKPRLYPGALAEIRRLREEGWRIVVISASAEVYMRSLLTVLPADLILATECEIDTDGRYTGHLGVNCKGAEKVRRWRKAAAELQWDAVRAYGDSVSDADMLRFCAEPVWVNASARARRMLPDAQTVRW